MTEIIPKEKRWKALSIGTFTGWLGVGLIDLFTLILMGGDAQNLLNTLFIGLCFYLIFGLPIAFILCFLMGIPIYLAAESFRPVDKYHAIIIGAILGTILGSISFIWFQTSHHNIWIWLDWLSTILVGGLAGYVSFSATKTDDRTSAETA